MHWSFSRKTRQCNVQQWGCRSLCNYTRFVRIKVIRNGSPPLAIAQPACIATFSLFSCLYILQTKSSIHRSIQAIKSSLQFTSNPNKVDFLLFPLNQGWGCAFVLLRLGNGSQNKEAFGRAWKKERGCITLQHCGCAIAYIGDYARGAKRLALFSSKEVWHDPTDTFTWNKYCPLAC